MLSGRDTAAALLTTQQLWLTTEDLPKIKTVTTPAWVGEELKSQPPAKELLLLMAAGSVTFLWKYSHWQVSHAPVHGPRTTYEEHLGAMQPGFGLVYECLSNGSPDDFGTAQTLTGARSLLFSSLTILMVLLALLAFCQARDRCDHSWKPHFFSNIFP